MSRRRNMKPYIYYKFIAPVFLVKKSLPLTKENIEIEAKRLQESDKK